MDKLNVFRKKFFLHFWFYFVKYLKQKNKPLQLRIPNVPEAVRTILRFGMTCVLSC